MPQVQRSIERNSNAGGFSQKKKFGKNLNKLVKPAPPIPNDKADHSAQNGLLLLSTKKTTSGLLASKTNTTISSGGVGSNGASIKHSSASTHDALLSAVAGASQSDAKRKLDAWGVAEQPKDQQQMQDVMEEEKNNTIDRNDYDAEHYDNSGDTHDNDQLNDPGAAWDEYGGRNAEDRGEKAGTLVEVDDQRERMARLARERAEIKCQEEEARVHEQKAKAAQRLEELDQKRGGKKSGEDSSLKARTLWQPDETPEKNPKTGKDNAKTVAAPKSKKLQDSAADAESRIHVASYEDRDRGERGPAAAPRMLYDPKSGSMVEVKARAETGVGGGGGNNNRTNRKERRNKPKKERDAAPEVVLKNGRNKQQKSRKESADANGHAEEKKKFNSKRRFPRTCGVLYRRDNKGNLQTADDCEGDLGYGAHSVPGGRTRNPEAYTAWKASSYDEYGDEALQGGLEIGSEYGLAVDTGLESGFASQDETPQPALEWIKPDDKIELVTGVDDSPTLKPTAREFAPSQAALAAAVAGGTSAEDRSDEISAGTEDNDPIVEQKTSENEEDASEEAEDGLGFDPLQGIDFMSSSPSQPSPSPDDIAAAVDLPSLALGQPMFDGSKADESALSRPLFGFGASDTWGTSGQSTNTNGLSGWGSDPVALGLFGSTDVFRTGEKEPEPPQLFSGSTGASWGPSGVLDRLPTINAEHTGPAD